MYFSDHVGGAHVIYQIKSTITGTFLNIIIYNFSAIICIINEISALMSMLIMHPSDESI